MLKSTTRKSIIYIYSTKHLSSSDLVRFYYASKGRDGKSGVLKELNAKLLAKSVILCSKEADSEMRKFLQFWKCKYSRKEISRKIGKDMLFTYSTAKLDPTNLVKFYYALKGRDGKSGVLKETKTKQLAKSVLIVSIKQLHEIEDFFRFWKIPTKKRGYVNA